MKRKIKKTISYKIFLTIIFSIIYSIGLQFFIQPANLLTTGLSGIVQIIDYITPISYGIIYFLINIPGIVLSSIYLGKKLTIYSIVSIITVSLFTSFVPITSVSHSVMLNAIFGGLLMGYSIGSLLKIGATSGGTDFYGMILLKYKNMDFSKVNLIINVSIILFGILIYEDIEFGLYTIVSLYTRNVMIDQVFTNAKTTTLFIVSENLDSTSNYINNVLKRGTTIIHGAEGGYTREKKDIIMTNLNVYEYSTFISYVDMIDDNIFVTVLDTRSILGNYKKTKGEIND